MVGGRGERVQLLINREYALTSSYDGRALAAIKQGVPLRMVWDGAHVTDNYWIVIKRGPNSANGQKFIAFVNRAEMAAGFTQWTGYPGPNLNQLKYLPADLVPLLSISPDNSKKVIRYAFLGFWTNVRTPRLMRITYRSAGWHGEHNKYVPRPTTSLTSLSVKPKRWLCPEPSFS